MNLEICEKECGIDGVVLYLCGQIDVKICDKKHTERYDLPCQKYSWNDKKPILNPKIKYFNRDNKDIKCGAYFANNKETKYFNVSKNCPFYEEHFIFDFLEK